MGLTARSWHSKPAQSLDHTVDLCLPSDLPSPLLFHSCLRCFSLSLFPLAITFIHCLPSVVLPVFLCFCSPCLFLSVRLLLSDLPVNHISQLWVQKRTQHSPPGCRALFKSQWDNDSKVLPVSLMWLAGQHSRSPERERRIHKHPKGFASLSVCLTLSLTHRAWTL